MTTFYDDNFGIWEDMDDPEYVPFYQKVQRKSVVKECAGCGRMVKIRPEYAYCNDCMVAQEQGIER